MNPAGNLYSSVNDQAKFLKFLFAGGKADGKQILKRIQRPINHHKICLSFRSR